MTILNQGWKTAKQPHHCYGNEYIRESGHHSVCERIAKGTKYFSQVHVFDGDLMVWKTCAACKKFCEEQEIDTSAEGNL